MDTPKTQKTFSQTKPVNTYTLAKAIDQLPFYIFWKDCEGVFLGCNVHFANAAGFADPSYLIGKTDYDMPWHEYAPMYLKDDLEVIQSGIPKYNIEEPQIRSDGKEIIILVNKVPLYGESGKIYGVLGIYTDITEQKNHEKELEHSKKQAEISDALKSEFIQNMQHDIRTPTAGIWSLLQLMHNEEEDPKKRESLALLTRSAKQLLDFCNEIIDFGNIENSNQPFLIEKINLHELTKQIIELEASAAISAKLDLYYSIDSDVPTVVKGDLFRLKRILINLISNALKFTTSGEVTLFITCPKKTDTKAYLTFKIHDTGPGISKNSRDLLFMDFTRGTPSAHSTNPGLGLGLRIVKKFVEEMDGEIEVESVVGRGSDFYVTLPFSIPLLDKDPTPPPLPSTKGKSLPMEAISYTTPPQENFVGHLLIVEDDKIAQTIAERHFTALGCTLRIAGTLAEAKKYLQEDVYDLIVLDLGLPDGSGLNFAQEINAAGNQPPIIAITAHSDTEKKKQAQQSGIATLMTKPLTRQRAEGILSMYLNAGSTSSSATIAEPAIDLGTGQALIHGDESQAKEMLETLLASLPNTLELLKIAVDSNDFEAFAFEIHKLKGALAYCGAPQLNQLVARIGETIRKKPAPYVYKRFYEEMYNETEALKHAFYNL